MNTYSVEENKIVFNCGCEFQRSGNNVVFDADLHNPNNTIMFDCPATFELLQKGLTEGVFQLCSPLGRMWCVKLQPQSLEHISALGSVLRPGALESKDSKGDSTTVRYERKKNGKMELSTYHPIVDKILETTYGESIYQEQSIELVKQCAGFSLAEADILRKGIGKKIPEVIAKCKKDFLQKGKEFGIFTDDQLLEIFSWIEASQRYQFNHSHAWSYGLNGYITAYQKAHFPLQFYRAWLANEDKRENYVNFVNEAKLFNINVYPPDIRYYKPDFHSLKGNIYFGLANIKGLVKKDLDSLSLAFAAKQWKFEDLGTTITWLDFLSVGLESVSSKTAEGLIHSGALDCFGKDRACLYYEYERWSRLTATEKAAYVGQPSLIDLLLLLITGHEDTYRLQLSEYQEKVEKRATATRKYKSELAQPKENRRLPKLREILQELQSPIYSVQDTVDSILFAEENLLGVALSKHKTDEIPLAAETATCLEIANGQKTRSVLKVKVDQVRATPCRNGKDAGENMCFMKISDRTTQIDALAFVKTYREFQHLLTRGNIVFVSGQLGDRGSFIVEKVYNVS